MKTLQSLCFVLIMISIGSTANSQCLSPNTFTTNIYSTQVKLNWDPVPDAVQYMLIASLQGIATIDTFYYPGADSFSVFSGLKKGSTYQWAMKSICDTLGTESALSQVVSFTTLPSGTCIPPFDQNTADITNNSADLNWDDVPDVVGYLIDLGGSISHITGNSTNWESLLGSTQYVWGVASICGVDTMPPSTWDTSGFSLDTFITASCPVPTFFMAGYIGEDSLDLSWSSVSNSESYILSGASIGTLSVTDTMYSINGLNPSTEYSFNIQTVCNSGGTDYMSEISDTLTITTNGSQANCNTPSPIFTSNITLETAKLNWSASPLALSYT
ncbi:MAG: fibronectin type III domain-containing protein, partial [Chitinophagales bacterium]|nr:fibronectin type III domain-containing protein [Chitinophagales bacterium]